MEIESNRKGILFLCLLKALYYVLPFWPTCDTHIPQKCCVHSKLPCVWHAWYAHNDVIPIDNDVIPTDNDVLSTDNDVISTDNDVISTDNDVISSENDVIPTDNDVIPTK